MWIRRLASTTPSEEQALLDTERSMAASGKRKVTLEASWFIPSALTRPPEYIMDDITTRAGKILEPFNSQEHRGKVPSPAFTLQVSHSIQPGSNLYAVQKTFSGPFQFDVFYESASANHKLDGMIPAP
jgi:hypothetical protein